MNYSSIIDYKLSLLIDLMLTDGVSPSDLANNIFGEEYISVSFKKKKDCVVGILNFYETGANLQNIELTYTYTNDRKLIRIEERNEDKISLLWDRKLREDELLEEILYFMKAYYNEEKVEKFINTLPEDLKNKISIRLELGIA